MNRTLTQIFVVWLVLLSSAVFPQRKQNVQAIQNEIRKLESELHTKNLSEKSLLSQVEDLEREIGLRQKLIQALETEKQSNERVIQEKQSLLRDLGSRRQRLESIIRKRLIRMYKRSRLGEWEALFLMKSFNQAIVWLKYNRRIIDNDQRNLKRLLETKTAIQTENEILEKELRNKNLLIQVKAAETDKMEKQKTSRTHLLSQARKDQQSLQEQIRLKKLAYQTIRGEIGRREKERKTTSRVDIGGTPFAPLKGKMAWPVRGNIVTKYGTQKAAATNTATPNYGIEIRAADRASVVAVCAGRVAKVVWLRGMGNIVILGHGGGYSTVYAHLDVVLVYLGQEISSQEIIGYVGDRHGLYGSNLHFQVWDKETVHNPETWLRK